MTTETNAGGGAATTENNSATAAAASPSSGGGAAPAGASSGASAADQAGATRSEASAGEGGKPAARVGGFMDDDGEGGGEGGAKETPEAVKAFAAVEGDDARKAAFAALSDDDKKLVAEALTDEERKLLGIEKPNAAAGAKTYEAFKMPEGVEVDGAMMEKAQKVFSGLNLDQAGAQQLVDFYNNEVGAMVKKASEAPYDLWRDTQKQWVDQVHDDKELGGPALDATKANAARAINALCSKEEAKALRDTLKFTGVTNNPEVLRFFARVGKRISEGQFAGGDMPAGTPKQAHEVMYPTTVKASE